MWRLRRYARRRSSYDVAILGGGLAGLTLAIQLKQMRPETQRRGAREARGAGAAGGVQGRRVDRPLRRPLLLRGRRDARPSALRTAASSAGCATSHRANGNEDITKRVEVGPPVYPPHDNFQLDRGLFENKLAARARALGVDLQQGARVREVDLDADPHRVTFEQFEQEATLERTLGRGRLGPRQHPQAQARPDGRLRAPHQLRVVSTRGRARPRAVGRRRRRVDGADVRSRAFASSAPTT